MKRATPCFDKWIRSIERKLAPRGAKADLARYLSEQYGRPARSWESNLSKVIARDLLPNAEMPLAIDAWRTRRSIALADTEAASLPNRRYVSIRTHSGYFIASLRGNEAESFLAALFSRSFSGDAWNRTFSSCSSIDFWQGCVP